MPRVRLAQQLADSNKVAILVLVVPHGRAWVEPAPSSQASDWRQTVGQYLEIFRGMGLVGQADGARVELGKLVYGAHGSSCPGVVSKFAANRDDFDELWLFDPEGIEPQWPALDHAGNARIRLIGGQSHPFLLSKMADLGDRAPGDDVHTIPASPANVTVWPRTATFWTSSKAYLSAFPAFEFSKDANRVQRREVTVDALSASEVENLRSEGPRGSGRMAESAITASTGIVRIEPEGGGPSASITLAGMLDNGAWTRTRTFEGYCLSELVMGYVAEFGEHRAQSETQFYMGFDWVVKTASARRREWALFGWQAQADGDDEDESDFKGYFQLCLEASQFESG
jgi:hypothetical protein